MNIRIKQEKERIFIENTEDERMYASAETLQEAIKEFLDVQRMLYDIDHENNQKERINNILHKMPSSFSSFEMVI